MHYFISYAFHDHSITFLKHFNLLIKHAKPTAQIKCNLGKLNCSIAEQKRFKQSLFSQDLPFKSWIELPLSVLSKADIIHGLQVKCTCTPCSSR